VSRIAHPNWSSQQRSLVTKFRSMVARFEETRDLRLMGGYTPGSDPDLDQAVASAPKLYEALIQNLNSPSSKDVFAELAEAFRGEQKSLVDG